MKPDYKFNIKDKIKMKATGEKGIILDRTFPVDTFAINVIPGKYYLIKTIAKYQFDDKGSKTNEQIMFSCRESSLEGISKKKS